MKAGDIVEIYEQPLSETKGEGKARLIRKIQTCTDGINPNGMEIWRVRLLNDGYYCTRTIKAID